MAQALRAVTPMVDPDVVELRTPRTRLRPIAPADRDVLHRLWTSPGVRRFLWDDEIIPIERTDAAIAQSGRMVAERTGGLWGMWLEQDAPGLHGFAGLWPFRDPPEIELVFGVAEPIWGRGYAPEVARAVTRYGFASLGLPIVRASTDAANAASIRVLEKLGFTLVERREAGGLDTVFFQVTRPSLQLPEGQE